MLLLSAGSDPFASLGLGFGTAYPIDIVDKPSPFDYMVTVEHQIFGLSFELADFVIAPQLIPPPGAPLNVSALLHASTRPKDRDLPWTEAVDVLWDRALPLLVTQPRPASYCVARFAPPPDPSAILLGKRFSGGWVPFAPTQRDDDSSSVQVLFSDGDVPHPADPNARTYTYSVTTQDLFGRWGSWMSAMHDFQDGPVQRPAILALQLTPAATGTGNVYAATLTLEFAYDWSDRSPEYIEFVGSFVEPPPDPNANPPIIQPIPTGMQFSLGGPVGATVIVQFGGADTPTITAPGATVVNTDPAPSDDVRHYRLTLPGFSLDFSGRNVAPLTVYARGAEHIPPNRLSDSTRPNTARAFSPVPPPAPLPPDQIIWTSLPDIAGVARAHLTWPDTGAPGYILYEASETALLQAANLPGPDLVQPFAARLATLRGLALDAMRPVFVRVQRLPDYRYGVRGAITTW